MEGSIGTYGEKTLHRELKWQIEPTGVFHEIPVGRYIADIKNDVGITEIQTRSFFKLRNKLIAFLPDYVVTLIYPIAHEKLILWTAKDSGDIIRVRRSPKQGSFYASFQELYWIKSLLTSPNLRLKLILLDVSEKRQKAGKRRGYEIVDTIIRSTYSELSIDCIGDYLNLIPSELEEPFTTRDYAKMTGLNARNAGIALNVLHFVGAAERVGKSGNFYLYRRHI